MPHHDGAGRRLPAEVVRDVAYTEPVPVTTKGNLLDLYLPARRTDRPLPLFIFTEGSAWMADNGKDTAEAWAHKLNPRGYAVAGVSVRSSDQIIFPGQLHDIKAAIRFLRANAASYTIDPDRFALAGFSSGGWAAAIAGTTADVPAALEGSTGVTGVSSRVQAVVTFSPPTAFRLMDSQRTPYSVLHHGNPGSPESKVTGCTQYLTGINDPACVNADRADPRKYVTPDDPPFLMFHGTNDPLLPPGQSQVLFGQLADTCVEAELHLLEPVGHTYAYLDNPGEVSGQTVSSLESGTCEVRTDAGLTPQNAPTVDLIAAFLERTIGRRVAVPRLSARLVPESVARHRVELTLRLEGAQPGMPTGVTFTSSDPEVLDASDVSVLGEGKSRAVVITPDRRAHGRARLVFTAIRGTKAVRVPVTVWLGSGAADRLRGSRGIDIVLGRGGNDRLLGRRGSDLLVGGPGADQIVGGRGGDVLVSGPGADRVVGGPGADRFVGSRHVDSWVDYDRLTGDMIGF